MRPLATTTRIAFLAILASVPSPVSAADAGKRADHWAFRAPERPALPAVRDGAWPRNPIDRFVLARIEAEGARPSPEADRATLIRRLSLDLLGLPPEPAEVDAFVLDARPDAYESLVERLLASPHYGERWGRHWLDAARYADTDGFEKDKARHVWFYRDWVIDAFNRDLPYDRFVIEQVAGDLLPGSGQDQAVATGFLRNSIVNEEGGIDPEQFRMEAMFDRVEAIGKGVLGLTVQCAQCHTHKFDPISPRGVLSPLRLPQQLRRARPPGLHPRRADARRRRPPDDRRGRGRPPPRHPRLARADGPLGGRPGQRARSRPGPRSRPPSRRSATAASATCPSPTARSAPRATPRPSTPAR